MQNYIISRSPDRVKNSQEIYAPLIHNSVAELWINNFNLKDYFDVSSANSFYNL